jgi:hypothetical protein
LQLSRHMLHGLTVSGVILVDDRHSDLLAQRRLGGVAEAGHDIVVGGDCLGAAVERAERDPSVDERYGDPLPQRRLGGVAEAATTSS